MKFSAGAMWILGCAACLSGQVSTPVRMLPDGMAEIRVNNGSAQVVTALAVRLDFPQASGVRSPSIYADAVVDANASELAAGEERRLEWGIVREKAVQARLQPSAQTAAIFADGSTFGDAALLSEIILRRRCMLQAVEAATEMLAIAGKHNVPRAQLIGQFQVMADSVYHWYLPVEQQVGRSVYQAIVEKLEALPEGLFGSPFPPAVFVEEQRVELNRRRVALTDSRPSLVARQ